MKLKKFKIKKANSEQQKSNKFQTNQSGLGAQNEIIQIEQQEQNYSPKEILIFKDLDNLDDFEGDSINQEENELGFGPWKQDKEFKEKVGLVGSPSTNNSNKNTIQQGKTFNFNQYQNFGQGAGSLTQNMNNNNQNLIKKPSLFLNKPKTVQGARVQTCDEIWSGIDLQNYERMQTSSKKMNTLENWEVIKNDEIQNNFIEAQFQNEAQLMDEKNKIIDCLTNRKNTWDQKIRIFQKFNQNQQKEQDTGQQKYNKANNSNQKQISNSFNSSQQIQQIQQIVSPKNVKIDVIPNLNVGIKPQSENQKFRKKINTSQENPIQQAFNQKFNFQRQISLAKLNNFESIDSFNTIDSQTVKQKIKIHIPNKNIYKFQKDLIEKKMKSKIDSNQAVYQKFTNSLKKTHFLDKDLNTLIQQNNQNYSQNNNSEQMKQKVYLRISNALGSMPITPIRTTTQFFQKKPFQFYQNLQNQNSLNSQYSHQVQMPNTYSIENEYEFVKKPNKRQINNIQFQRHNLYRKFKSDLETESNNHSPRSLIGSPRQNINNNQKPNNQIILSKSKQTSFHKVYPSEDSIFKDYYSNNFKNTSKNVNSNNPIPIF